MTWTAVSPRNVLFWSGAGISHDTPTNGPLGRDLTERAMKHFMTDDTGQEIAKLYTELGVRNANFRPRLETVLDALTDVYGLAGLENVLSDLVDAKPNTNHAFFAQHLRVGGQHITANFDSCIERAGLEQENDELNRVVHIHESVGGNRDLSSLGARLHIIENGFPETLVQTLDSVLGSDGISTIVFLGYSGSDFFDATPYLLSHLDLLEGKKIVWHDYQEDTSSSSPKQEQAPGTLLGELLRNGVRVEVISGTLWDFLSRLSVAWSIPYIPATKKSDKSNWNPSIGNTDTLRKQATSALYIRMGFRRGVIRAFSIEDPKDAQGWEGLADAHWGAGNYLKALGAWEQVYLGDDDASKARIGERRGATLWIRGQLLAAERHMWQQVNKWGELDSPAGSSASIATLETYGRIIQHMQRLPDVKWFVNSRKVEEVEHRLIMLANTAKGHEGIVLKAKLLNVISALKGEEDANLQKHIDSFTESEALHAWLNFEHALLRLRATKPTKERPAPNRLDYELQLRRQEALGATADVARTYLLPGATRYFTPMDVFKAFKPVEITSWHRGRLVGGFAALWLIEQFRRRKQI
ncbi:MAG TPA: hypothetical protein VMW30_10195 [Candidatus Paceibacterota bacterium]|nr:hypothetical protein [Candidatus Paceibacterota bacterium]